MFSMKRTVLFLILLALPGSLMSFSHDRQIRVQTVYKNLELKTLTEDEVKALLIFKKSAIFTEKKLEIERTRLKQLGYFDKIKIDYKKIAPYKVDIFYHLSQAKLIQKVSVDGNMPFLEKRILRLSSFRPGEAFLEDDVPKSIKRIQEHFSKHGYYDTKVEIINQDNEKTYTTNVFIKIKRGPSYFLGDVFFQGNNYYSSDNLRNKISGVSTFKIKQIKKKLGKIKEDYIEEGFVRARVKLDRYILNKSTNKIDVFIKIEERKRLFLKFEGNTIIKDTTLRDYVNFYKEQAYDRFTIERSLKKLTRFYRLNGFLFATIKSETEKDDETIRVKFIIDEGPRTRLKKIHFNGNKSLSNKKLESVLRNKEHSLSTQGFYNLNYISTDLESLITLYQDEGFLEAKIESWTTELNEFRDMAILHISISEGPAYTIDKVNFSGFALFDLEKIQSKADLKINKNFKTKRVIKAQEKIKSLYEESGYPYIETKVVPHINKENKTVSLDFSIEEGVEVKVGDIIVHGENFTKRDIVYENIQIKTGDLFRYKDILDAQLNLKRLNIFDNVRILPIGLESQKETVNIAIYLHERKRTTIDLQAGFDSDKLGSGQLLITHRNLMGLGKQLQLRLLAGFELSRAELSLFSPQIFGSNWNLLNQVFVEYEDDENFNAFSYGSSVGVLKRFGQHFTLILKEQITRFELDENNSNQAALDRNLFDNTFNELSVSVSFDNRDNFSDPQKGIYTLFSSEFNTDLANPENNFNIMEFNFSHYLGFAKRFTLINTFRLGKIFRIHEATLIPANKLFFIGGNDTVRGFDEDVIDQSGGTTMMIYNAELHFRLFGSLKLAGFYDMGTLTEEFNDISKETWRNSAGAGLRYMTPVGPIRLDYGFVLDQKENEPGQRFHFSFGYFF